MNNNTKILAILLGFILGTYGLNLHYSQTIIKKETPLNKVDNTEFQILLLKVEKLERLVDGLIQYDQEHWERYVKQQKENNKFVFPRVDHYCGERMVGQKIYDICKEEDRKFKKLFQKQEKQ